MTIFSFTRTSTDNLSALKQQYIQHLASPLDGMWQTFAAMADQYVISCDDKIVGYGIINADRKILQFFVPNAAIAEAAFDQFLIRHNVTGAFVTTNQVDYLSLCMDYQISTTVNALTYRVNDLEKVKAATFLPNADFRLAKQSDLNTAIKFGCQTLGTDPTWLTDYFSERINGKELFCLWVDDLLVATGECRPSSEHPLYADLGMLVGHANRRQGLATRIMQHLIIYCRERGLRPICSTERGNIAAQKSIIAAGFIRHHRILEIMF